MKSAGVGDVGAGELLLELPVLLGAHHDLHLRGDAHPVDLGAARREVMGRRQPQALAVLQREYRLDRALPERALADDDGAAGVLEGAGHDLGGARRVRVDEDGDRDRQGVAVRLGDVVVPVLGLRPWVYTTSSPFLKKGSATSTAASISPPGLLRRSMTRLSMP